MWSTSETPILKKVKKMDLEFEVCRKPNKVKPYLKTKQKTGFHSNYEWQFFLFEIIKIFLLPGKENMIQGPECLELKTPAALSSWLRSVNSSLHHWNPWPYHIPSPSDRWRETICGCWGSGRGSYLQSLAPVCQLCLTGRIRSWGVLLYRNVTSTHVLFLTEGIYMCMCIQPLHELW